VREEIEFTQELHPHAAVTTASDEHCDRPVHLYGQSRILQHHVQHVCQEQVANECIMDMGQVELE